MDCALVSEKVILWVLLCRARILDEWLRQCSGPDNEIIMLSQHLLLFMDKILIGLGHVIYAFVHLIGTQSALVVLWWVEHDLLDQIILYFLSGDFGSGFNLFAAASAQIDRLIIATISHVRACTFT